MSLDTGSLKLFQLETPNGKVNGKLHKFGSSESVTQSVTLELEGTDRETEIDLNYDRETDSIYIDEMYKEEISVPYQDFKDLFKDAVKVKTPQDVVDLLRKVYKVTKDMNVYSALELAESLCTDTEYCTVNVGATLGNSLFEINPIVMLKYDNIENQNGVIFFNVELKFDDATGKILFRYDVSEAVGGDKRAVNYIRKKMMDVNDYKDVVGLLYEIDQMKEGELF